MSQSLYKKIFSVFHKTRLTTDTHLSFSNDEIEYLLSMLKKEGTGI